MGTARDSTNRVEGTSLPAETPDDELGSTCMRMDISGASDASPRRPTNMDHFLAGRVERSLEVMCSNLPSGTVPRRHGEFGYGMLVADGIGGSAHGGQASVLAIQTLVKLLLNAPAWILRSDDDRVAAELLRRASDRYAAVNQALAEAEERNPALRGWGTTLTAALSLGANLFVAHIGDSRAYLLRGGKLLRLTRDHTMAATLAEAGLRVWKTGETHRFHHLLTRYLGSKDSSLKADLLKVRVEPGDRLLLCTDGLTNSVTDHSITALLGGAASADAACKELIQAALTNQADDNVTVVVGRFLEE